MNRFIIGILLLIFPSLVYGQYATRKVSKAKQDYVDSLKQVNYDYLFPILGQKTYKAGFDIPYPVGIMGNYLTMNQGVLINNMRLGVKTDNVDIPLTNVDELIVFANNTNQSYTVNIRPDIWIFPFLNVYGLFGYGRSSTTVNLVEPVGLSSTVEQGIRTMGVGVMGAFGVGPVWVSLDGNFTWNKPELLDNAVPVSVFGVRVGHTFEFSKRPDRNFAIWGGAMRARMGAETVGQIKLADALPPEVFERPQEIVDAYNAWYNDLPGWKQTIVDESPLPAIIDRIANLDGSAIVRYGMDKQVAQEWNGIFGAQFQLNKRWMFRTEWGVIGDRKSALVSVNYRFLL
jgi:hypothetical protein